MKKKNYHHGNLKKATIEEAISFVKKNNHFEFSMRDLAKNLNVSHQAPYRHFKTKEDLLTEIAKEGFQILTSSLEKKIGSEKISKLIESVSELYIQFGIFYPVHYRLMFGGVISDFEIYPELNEFSLKSYDTFKKMVSLLIKSKIIKKQDSNLITFYSWSLLHGFTSLLLDKKLSIALKKKESLQILPKLIQLFKRGVR
jgi:AcrR family transcriptional regulator